MVTDGVTSLFGDLWEYLKTGLWNWTMAVYGALIAAWEFVASWLAWGISPTSNPTWFISAAIGLGSFIAFRDAKREALWDRQALTVVDWGFTSLPEELGQEHITWWSIVANAGVHLPYPHEIRIVFDTAPDRLGVDLKYPSDEVMNTSRDSRREGSGIEIRGRRIVLPLMPPSLSPDAVLTIEAGSESVYCHLVEVAARRYKAD